MVRLEDKYVFLSYSVQLDNSKKLYPEERDQSFCGNVSMPYNYIGKLVWLCINSII